MMGVMFINRYRDIRFINEQTLITILICANLNLKNPKWSDGSFVVIVVQI